MYHYNVYNPFYVTCIHYVYNVHRVFSDISCSFFADYNVFCVHVVLNVYYVHNVLYTYNVIIVLMLCNVPYI